MRSIEKLVHFQCNDCKGWWTIGDAPPRKFHCPWCGVKESEMDINTIFSIMMQGRGDMSYLAKLKPRVVKLMDMKQEEVDEIRRLTPDSFIINRIYVDDGEVNRQIKENPEQAAIDHCNLILSKRLTGVDFYQIQNEQLQHPPDLQLLNEYYVKLINLAVLNGFKTTVIDCSVGNLHVGEDHPGDWEYVFPTLELAQQHGFPVNVHQYSKESFWNPEYPNEWYLHRLELTAMPVLDKSGFDKLLYVVGEFGLTNMLGGGSPGGWQTWLSHDEYRQDLINVMGYLLEWSDRVLGYCCYLTHAFSPWQTHEMFEMNQDLADHYSENKQNIKPLIDGGNGGKPPVLYQARVTAATLNVRSSPNGTIVGQVNRNDVVDVLNDDGVWWNIRHGDINGWSHSDYLQPIVEEDLDERVRVLEEQVKVLQVQMEALVIVTQNHGSRITELENETPPPEPDARLSPAIDYMSMVVEGSVRGYSVLDCFTTFQGSWDVSSSPFSITQWARDKYLLPPNDPHYHDEAGGDHHIFARVEDGNENFLPNKNIIFERWDGGNVVHTEIHTTSDKHGWCNIPIFHGSFWTMRVDDGQRMSMYAMPNADGTMPGREHVSLFVVFRKV